MYIVDDVSDALESCSGHARSVRRASRMACLVRCIASQAAIGAPSNSHPSPNSVRLDCCFEWLQRARLSAFGALISLSPSPPHALVRSSSGRTPSGPHRPTERRGARQRRRNPVWFLLFILKDDAPNNVQVVLGLRIQYWCRENLGRICKSEPAHPAPIRLPKSSQTQCAHRATRPWRFQLGSCQWVYLLAFEREKLWC